MLVPERTLKTGRVCPSFQIDDDIADKILQHRWCLASTGYLQATIKRKAVFLHRYVWVIKHGTLPVMCIDHINRDKLDNRCSNLRAVTYSENTQNGGSVKPCGSGSTKKTTGLPVGVYCVTRRKGSSYRVVLRGKHVGYFDSIDAAFQAYLFALEKLKHECQSNGTILRVHPSLDRRPAVHA